MSEEKKKNRAAVALGRRGGKMRAAKLSAEELSAQGKRAATIRWQKSRPPEEEPVLDLTPPEPIKPEVVSAPPEPVIRRPEPRLESRDSNVILTLKEQGYEVGEPALHPDGFWRVNVRSHHFSAWVTTGQELLDVAAGRLTLEAVMKQRQTEQRSAAAAGQR